MLDDFRHGVGICGMWVVDDATAYAVGRWNGPAVFLRTTDGGASWESKELDALGAQLNRFRMLSPDLGYAAGRRVYRYEGQP